MQSPDPSSAQTLEATGDISPERNGGEARWTPKAKAEVVEKDAIFYIKRGIWIYFFLLIFEGALRKWILAPIAAPLLVIRDPFAVGVLALAIYRGIFPMNLHVILMVAIAVLGIFTAMIMGHGNIIVAAYGARILLIHFPLAFVIGAVFTPEDVLKMGKATLWIAIPMTILIALQFMSPQSSLVNRGVGGDEEGAGFAGAMGYFRPPGTFSFTNGTTLFYGFLAPFVLYFGLNPKNVNKIALIGAAGGLMASIPLSISRGLLFQVVITCGFAAMAMARQPKLLVRLIMAGLVGLILFAIASQQEFFQTSMEAFTARFENASKVEGGLAGTINERFLGGLLTALQDSVNQPLFGLGIGMGTNVGAIILSGERQFLIAEGEWARVVGEMGPILGLLVIAIRLDLVVRLSILAYFRLADGNLLPWLLISYAFLSIAQSGWQQPTSLGFFVMSCGLLMASMRLKKKRIWVSKKPEESNPELVAET